MDENKKVLYLVYEGILDKTSNGKEPPGPLVMGEDIMKTIALQDWDIIVVIANQTWVQKATGVRVVERIWSRLKYVTECFREVLEKAGKYPDIQLIPCYRVPWIPGINLSGEIVPHGTTGVFLGPATEWAKQKGLQVWM